MPKRLRGRIDMHHKTEIESLQPTWVVARGGAPGLSAEDSEAMMHGRVPPSYVASGIQDLARAGTYILLIGIVGLVVGATLAVFEGWLIGALIGFVGVLASFMGWMLRRGASRSPADYPAAYDRPALLIVGPIQRKWSGRGQGNMPRNAYIEIEQLVFTVSSSELWNRLQVGPTYRCWYLPIAVHDRTGALLWIELYEAN